MYKGKNKYKWKITICICLLLLEISMLCTNCMAGNLGSIRVKYSAKTKQNEEIILNNVGFSLYYVGEMENGNWILTKEFKNSDVSLKSNEASERNKQAKQLYEYASKEKIQGIIQNTNDDGVIDFTNLEDGLYLIAQTEDWYEVGTEAFYSEPFLVSVPIEINGTLTRNIESRPKSSWKTLEKKENVKTGDSMSGEIVVLILISSGLCIYACLRKKVNR